jgi:hypothetical protein
MQIKFSFSSVPLQLFYRLTNANNYFKSSFLLRVILPFLSQVERETAKMLANSDLGKGGRDIFLQNNENETNEEKVATNEKEQ